jgi:hypothetical protein
MISASSARSSALEEAGQVLEHVGVAPAGRARQQGLHEPVAVLVEDLA